MAGNIGQTVDNLPTGRMNQQLAEDNTNLKQNMANHEAVIVSGEIPAEFNTASFFQNAPKGIVDGSNKVFTLNGLPDTATLTGTQVTSGVTQELIEDVHYARQGKVLTFGTAPPLLAALRFSFGETTEGSTLKIPHRLNKKPKKCWIVNQNAFGSIRVVSSTDRDITFTADKKVNKAMFLLEG